MYYSIKIPSVKLPRIVNNLVNFYSPLAFN